MEIICMCMNECMSQYNYWRILSQKSEENGNYINEVA